MVVGLKRNGTRAFAVATVVCAALSPAALVAAGGAAAQGRDGRDAAAPRLVRTPPKRVIRAADGVLSAGAPGVAVEYRDARKPALSWSVRRGTGDLASGAPVPPDASFRIGSVTKTYLATAVLGAVGEGRISLDDTLGHWLPGVLPRLDERTITVRMLLDHTSGVPDPSPRLLAHPALFGKGAVTPADLVGKARNLPPVAAPGVQFTYSNADYWLLAMILERATGQSYAKQIETRVLRPLGLGHTVLPSDTTSLPSPFLHGYTLRPGRPPLDVSAFNSSWASSSGGIVSTTADLDRFASALLGGRLMAPAELAQMKRGVRVPANPMGVSVYGLGLTRMRLPCGVTLYGNMGGLAGYTTWVQSTTDGSRSIAVAANTDELPRIDRSIGKVVDAAFCG
ncbi:MAG TPA: serine hydrolase domain-containing protein [Solirubrobacterales bacterium]